MRIYPAALLRPKSQNRNYRTIETLASEEVYFKRERDLRIERVLDFEQPVLLCVVSTLLLFSVALTALGNEEEGGFQAVASPHLRR